MTTWLNDFQNAIKAGVSIPPGTQQIGDGTVNGGAVDLDNTQGPTHAAVLIGESDEYDSFGVSIKLQESDDGLTGWTDIDESNIKTEVLPSGSADANENTVVKITAKNRSKRYVRTAVEVAGTEESSGASPTLELASLVFAMHRQF